jgi:hypothetical protein
MQKLINVVALLSGLTSLGLIGGSAYLLLNKDTLIESARENVTKAVTETVTQALPGMLDAAMPKMPEVTGGAIPQGGSSLPKTTGPAMPF